MLWPLAEPAVAGEIDACKYLVVTDFSSDPYGIAKELRAQARSKGFTVISAVTDVPEADLFKVCLMTGSWSSNGLGGQISIRVLDAGGALIGEAATGGTNWWGVGRTVRKAVSKIYAQLGYTGSNEEVCRQRMQRIYPSRPKIAITEDEIKKTETRSPVEGIWSDPQDRYRLGIVPAPKSSDADYVAVVLRSNQALWQPGEIKAEIRSTASADIFTCTYFLANKKPAGTTLSLEHDSVLRGSLPTPKGSTDLLLVRVWPSIAGESTRAAAKSGASGTGFLLSRSGLIATNWHVVADAKKIGVTFPGWTNNTDAEIVVRDVVNDLAVLRVTDTSRIATTCPELPFELSSAERVTLGQRVSTIGYPLTSLLGSIRNSLKESLRARPGSKTTPACSKSRPRYSPGPVAVRYSTARETSLGLWSQPWMQASYTRSPAYFRRM